MHRIVLAAALLCVPQLAEACSCAWPGRACTALARTTVVFSGRVSSIGEVRTAEGYTQVLVRFDVLESFKGVNGKTVEVTTGQGGGDCGIRFERGVEYLVYAHYWDKTDRLYTGICTRTAKLKDAGEDVDYLRRRDDPALGKGILGQIEKLRRVPADGTYTEWDGWLTGARVVVSQGSTKWETATDNKGQFRVWGLAPGRYRLSATLPPGYIGGEIEQIEIPARDACSEVRILATPEWKPPAKSRP